MKERTEVAGGWAVGRAPAVFGLLTLLPLALPVRAAPPADWPTYLANNQRNAVSAENLAPPLTEAWAHRAAFPPEPAWPPPANQNFYGGVFGIEPWASHENALQVCVAGDALYYGSPANHALQAVDVVTGQPRWTFFTEGPVRYAPAIANGRVCFGSDDGFIYSVDLQGKLLWKTRAAPPEQPERRLPGNGHMISMWPVRGGIVIENGQGYACAGIFPEQGVVRCSFEPDTGRILWRSAGDFFDGYLVLAGDRIAVSGGRVGGNSFSLRDGKPAGGLGGRGTYLVAAGTNLAVQAGNRRSLSLGGVSLPADFLVQRDGIAYVLGRQDLSALRADDWVRWMRARAAAEKSLQNAQSALAKLKKAPDPAAEEKLSADAQALQGQISEAAREIAAAVVWTRTFATNAPVPSYSFIMAGDLLFAGRSNAVAGFSAKDGSEVWTAPVTGSVYGLAAARGRLFASTDAGMIHCFTPGGGRSAGVVDLAQFERVDRTPSARARRVLASVQEKRGYALVLADLGADELSDLANRTSFRIVAIPPDAARVAPLREALSREGLQGRVAIHPGSFAALPYPVYFANLVVLSSEVTVPPAEIARVLQPCGGVAVMADGSSLKAFMKGAAPAGAEFVSDSVLKRGALPGAGEWTHQYASPANTATSGDPYVRGKLDMTWFGDPGPRDMIDRHNRTMAPLVRNGRLFVPANEKIIAVNAYNGARLWELPVPGSRRVGVLKDSGQMVVADDAVCIAVKDQCWKIDPASGRHEGSLRLPASDGPRSWGYLAAVDDLVLGSIERTNASFGVHCNMCPILEGDFRPVIMSESLFCLDRKTGAEKWHYRRGPIFNSAIAAAGGRVFFLESRQPAAASNTTGRIRVDQFLGGTNRLVALDLKTGAPAWEQPVTLGYQHIVYLQAAGNLVVTMGTCNKEREISGKKGLHVHYAFHAFAAGSGEPAWQSEIPTGAGPGGEHGEQWQHPVIIGDEILTKYFACDLRTGAPLPGYPGGGPGSCGTWAASASAVFGHGGGLNLDTRQGIRFTKISREGCFVNVIPAGGVLCVPQTGAGCTCAYPLELSMGFAPADGLAPIVYPLNRKFVGTTRVSIEPRLPEFPVRYTTDGSAPGAGAPVYTQPFEIDADTTVKACLWGPAPATNGVVTVTFTKLPPAEKETK